MSTTPTPDLAPGTLITGYTTSGTLVTGEFRKTVDGGFHADSADRRGPLHEVVFTHDRDGTRRLAWLHSVKAASQ